MWWRSWQVAQRSKVTVTWQLAVIDGKVSISVSTARQILMTPQNWENFFIFRNLVLPCVVDFRLCLTHFPLVTHIWVSESGQHWFRQWLVAYSAPSHYLNQCWFIVNWTFTNKLYWCFNQNTKLYIHKNASQNIVCEKAAILSRGKWVNSFSTASAVLNQIIILYTNALRFVV